jgi:trehalose/maltose hydrolase-like predicted phosphorylase
LALLASAGLVGLAAGVPAASAAPAARVATSAGAGYAPTFTGNGVLGVRVPTTGQGYAGGSVPALSELAGFYAQPSGGVQQRASIPTWSTLSFSDGGQDFSLSAGTVSGWRQTLGLRTGVVTTAARWTAPDGHVTDLAYELLTDRALAHIGLVRLALTPDWSGTASVTDLIDGTPATLTSQTAKGWGRGRTDWVSVQAQGTGLTVALASSVGVSADIRATTTQVDQPTAESVGQQLTFPVRAGRTYVITKYVAVESSQTAAVTAARDAARVGFARLLRANDAAWAKLWRGRIDVLGDRALAGAVSASEFYLWSSVRQGTAWSVSPAGLSSNGYNGHIFWDAETWMFPALLAQHPDLAAGIVAYRYDRLHAAEQHASATGYAGARFPWESALDGTEQIPPPEFVNSEGVYEQHITADVALAQWQYYLATGDRRWLSDRSWPVLSGAAAFWASRATLGSDGGYHIDGVTGPDEDNPDVNDEAYTNVAAMGTLADAIAAARVLGRPAPGGWASIAAKLVVPVDGKQGIHPEFSGYLGQQVKQADVTLLQYPWGYAMPAGLAQGDVDYYVPRSDPGGPSMTDAISAIDSAALGSPGCSSYVYTERSYEPFIRDVFDQFSETRTGGAFTFTTGIGGFLQEFLYGYSGLRLGASAVALAPSLTGQLGGIVLRDLAWHGRLFTVAIGPRKTMVSLLRGSSLPIGTPAGRRVLTRRHPLSLPTHRPDLVATSDTLRCGGAAASSSQPGAPPLAAVDGSSATDWEPVSLPAGLTAPVAGGAGATISHATLEWGQEWIPAFLPNAGGPPLPVATLRATSYAIQVSSDGHNWRTVATVTGRVTGTEDSVAFAPTRANYVRVQITGAVGGQPPLLDELAVPSG